jgi:hypothetical protein
VSDKAERLGRLLAIRRLSEDLDRRALQLAMAAVTEIEAALARQEAALEDARAKTRMALSDGDRSNWLLADAQSEVAGWNQGRLGSLLRVRAGEVAPAMERFVDSRREHEQVKQLVDNAEQAARGEEDHRAQAAADDWFLSKRARQGD